MSKKCVCYIRVSTEEQLLGNGVERQRETIKRYLTTLPYVDENDLEERVDEGRSAFKGTHMKKTSKLGRYFSELDSGKYDGSVLVMESLDRFSRQNSFEALSNILKLVNEHQIEVHSITPAIVIKQSDPSSLLMATMITSRAHEESVIKSTRKLASAKAKREKAIETGGVITKRTPAWLDVLDGKYVENEFANVVRRIFNEYSSGIKSSTIAKKLNSEGITYQNRKFTTQSVLWILNNRSVIGKFKSKTLVRDNDTQKLVEVREVELDNIYPAIIPNELFDYCNNARDKGRYKWRIVNDTKKSVFSTVFRCICGSALSISATKKTFVYAVCNSRRDQLGCNEFPLKYYNIERGLLTHLKHVDFSSMFSIDKFGTELMKLRIRQDELNATIEEYSAGIEKLKLTNRKPSFDMLMVLDDSKVELSRLKEEIEGIENRDGFTKIDFDDSVFDLNNIELRCKVEMAISDVVEHIAVSRPVKNDEVICRIVYKNKRSQHFVVISNKTGNVLWELYSESNHDELTMKGKHFNFNTNTGELKTDSSDPIGLLDELNFTRRLIRHMILDKTFNEQWLLKLQKRVVHTLETIAG